MQMTKGEEKVRQSRKQKLPSGTRNKLTQVRKRNQGKPKAQNAELNRRDGKLKNSRERVIADVTGCIRLFCTDDLFNEKIFTIVFKCVVNACTPTFLTSL